MPDAISGSVPLGLRCSFCATSISLFGRIYLPFPYVVSSCLVRHVPPFRAKFPCLSVRCFFTFRAASSSVSSEISVLFRMRFPSHLVWRCRPSPSWGVQRQLFFSEVVPPVFRCRSLGFCPRCISIAFLFLLCVVTKAFSFRHEGLRVASQRPSLLFTNIILSCCRRQLECVEKRFPSMLPA